LIMILFFTTKCNAANATGNTINKAVMLHATLILML